MDKQEVIKILEDCELNPCNRNDRKAVSIAIQSMKKLEKIEQIVEQYQFYKFDGFIKIKEILEQE